MSARLVQLAVIEDVHGVNVRFSDGEEMFLTREEYAELLAGIVARECKECPRLNRKP